MSNKPTGIIVPCVLLDALGLRFKRGMLVLHENVGAELPAPCIAADGLENVVPEEVRYSRRGEITHCAHEIAR